jgi:hypothetical protein
VAAPAAPVVEPVLAQRAQRSPSEAARGLKKPHYFSVSPQPVCSAVQCSAVQYNVVQCSAVQCATTRLRPAGSVDATFCRAAGEAAPGTGQAGLVVQCSVVQCSVVKCSAAPGTGQGSIFKRINSFKNKIPLSGGSRLKSLTVDRLGFQPGTAVLTSAMFSG